MKPKDLYKRFSMAAAKIDDVLTTQKATGADIYIEDKADRFFEKVQPKKAENKMDLENEWDDVYADIYDLGLVKGYLIGQLFDLKDPEILRNLEVIKRELVKEGLFDFLPKIRNKRAA